MSKNYQKPAMRVVNLQHRSCILSGSVESVGGNTEIRYGGASKGVARSRGRGGWDDDE